MNRDEHDPLCADDDAEDEFCHCDLIARVRADEREDADLRLRMRVHEINDQVAAVVRAAEEQVVEQIAQAIENARVALPDETPSYRGTIRSRDDMSFALARARNIARWEGT